MRKGNRGDKGRAGEYSNRNSQHLIFVADADARDALRRTAAIPQIAADGSGPGMSCRVEMMGCLIDNLSMEETLQRIEGFIESGCPHQHVVVNVDKLVKASRDPEKP